MEQTAHLGRAGWKPEETDPLIESLGDRLGTEEILILALILILSGSGGGECEDAGDVILLLALLLILG